MPASVVPDDLSLTSTLLPRGDALRQQLRWVTLAWLFGSFWMWTINGAAMTQFARALGTPDYGFGILAALPFIGTLIQLPASYALERFGRRRQVFLIASTAGRLLWTVTAAIPWLLPVTPQLWWLLMAVSIGLSWTLLNVGGPAWMNWMSDLIPRRLRGRYFGIRNMAAQPVGLLATLGIGFLLDRAEHVAGLSPADGQGVMILATSTILAVAGVVGAVDILCFLRVKDPDKPRDPEPIRLRDMIRQPLADANFRRFLAFNFIFTLGVGFIGQYVWLFLFDVALWSNARANLLIIAVPIVARMVLYKPWGRMVDRLGKKPVMLISGAFTVFGAFGWLLITPESMWLGYSLVLLVTLAWPGMEIANFNFLLDLAGSHKPPRRPRGEPTPTHDKRIGGTAYVAMFSITVAVGGILSGLFGTAIASSLRDMVRPIDLGVVHITLTYHGLLFLVSTALRAAAMVFLLGVVEPQAVATRDAMRYMTLGFYSNMQRLVMTPTRVAGQVFRWTYRLRPPGETEHP